MDWQTEEGRTAQGGTEGQRGRHENGLPTEQKGPDRSLSPFLPLGLQSVPQKRRAGCGQIAIDRWSSKERRKTTAVSEADGLCVGGTRAPSGETRLLGNLPREEAARSGFPGKAAHAAAKGPRSSLPCDFVPVAAGWVPCNISRSALTGSRGEGNRASLAHLAFPPTPGGV